MSGQRKVKAVGGALAAAAVVEASNRGVGADEPARIRSSATRMSLGDDADAFDRLLHILEPASFVDENAGRQQHKSSQTRTALLEAAIDCLAQYGYAQTTAQLIAARAELSRGAMLHHYATKRDLIESVIDYICFKRMKNFVESIRFLSDRERVEEQAGLEFYWQSFLSREFQAFLELQIAARTDEELRNFFEPKARRFDELQRQASRMVFPEYENNWEKLDIAVDFCQATMQGLVLNRNILEPRSRRLAIRRLFSAAIYAFRTGAITIDLPIEERPPIVAVKPRTARPRPAKTAPAPAELESQTIKSRRKRNA
jgi:AcrR family transcriptional regulator